MYLLAVLRSRSRSRPEPYFLVGAGAGAEIISYFRLRKIPYRNDFITTIFFSDHGIFITNIFKNNSYLLTLTSIFSIQPSKILYNYDIRSTRPIQRHSLSSTFFSFLGQILIQAVQARTYLQLCELWLRDRCCRLRFKQLIWAIFFSIFFFYR